MSEALRKAAEQAIADLEHISAAGGMVEFVERRITALKAALAEPDQEPVDFDTAFDAVNWDEWRHRPVRELVRELHKVTTPPRRELLTPWIKTSEQYPPEGVRVFWFNPNTNQVGYDTWMGGDYKFNVEYWMHIPGITGENT